MSFLNLSNSVLSLSNASFQALLATSSVSLGVEGGGVGCVEVQKGYMNILFNKYRTSMHFHCRGNIHKFKNCHSGDVARDSLQNGKNPPKTSRDDGIKQFSIQPHLST